MSQTTNAVIAELMDRRLLNNVDDDLHQEIAEAVIQAARLSRPDTAEARLREAFVRVLASLAAAISLLERTPKAKKAAPSDTMFAIMLDDYRKALGAGRKALSPPSGGDEAKKSEGGKCAGGIDPGWDECPKCGASSDEECALIVESEILGPSEPSPPADRREIVAQALSFLRDVAQNKETWTPEAERVYQHAQKTVAALDGGRDA